VVLPDLFAGDALKLGDYSAGKVDFPTWLAKHPAESVDAIVEAAFKHLRQDLGIKKVVAVGYCFGAKVRS
jgi:dienelactone hydrolase